MDAMAQKVQIPGTGATVDPDDPSGTFKGIVLSIISFAILIAIAAMGQDAYNRFVAEPTGENFAPKSELI